MPLFVNAAPPLALYDANLFDAGATTQTANTVLLSGVYTPVPVVLTGIRVRFGVSGNGTCDLGIYDTNGNLLNHSGATTTSGGVFTYTLGTAIALSAGQYWLAYWISNNTDTIYRFNWTSNFLVAKAGSATSNLPNAMSSITSLANTGTGVAIMGLVQGGWS